MPIFENIDAYFSHLHVIMINRPQTLAFQPPALGAGNTGDVYTFSFTASNAGNTSDPIQVIVTVSACSFCFTVNLSSLH